MSDWADVDTYIESHLLSDDDALNQCLVDSTAAGLPPIAVSPSQGKMLHILALSIGAKHILEVGTLGGYSTIWLGRALGDGGTITSLEISAHNADVARKNLGRANLADKAEVIVGPAIETLPGLAGPFDFVFIDANKSQNPEYFQLALDRTRPGGVIIVDNVVRNGRTLDAASSDADIQGVRRLFEMLGQEKRVVVTAVQTVGSKGWDGFAIARVN